MNRAESRGPRGRSGGTVKSPRITLRALEVRPLTPRRWEHLAELFTPRGACGGCWCMYWKLARSRFESRKGVGNRRSLRKIVDGGDPPGLLAYLNGRPVA